MNVMKSFAYHLKTLWLFTKSDMPTSTGINSTFAVVGVLAGPSISDAKIDLSDLWKGVLVTLYFTWHLTLCFNLGNQRQPSSIIEDGVNKPWRPIPAGRITPEAARVCHLVAVITMLGLCVAVLGAWQETAFYLFCTWLYNEQAWGDKSWWKRALMNACGITTNRVASLHVVINAIQQGDQFRFTDKALGWFLICAGIVIGTIQVQDLRDQEGDAEIDRQTLPLLIGDAETRWITAAGVWFFSLVSPLYWNLGIMGYIIPVLAAAGVTAHMLMYQTRERDQLSFRLVAVWWVSLYFLPMMKSHGM